MGRGSKPANYFGMHRGKGDESVGEVMEFLVGGEGTANWPRQMHIAQSGDSDSDWATADSADPIVLIHSTTTPTTDFISLTHDGTNGTISSAGGTLDLDGIVSTNLQVSGTTHWSVAASVLAHSAANAGAVSTLTVTNTSDDSGAGAEIGVVAGGSSASGDAKFSALQTSGHEITIGIDTSASLGVICMGATLGAGDTDAIRITDATPPVATYNATHPTGTFDYVCEECGQHGGESFECHGAMAPWHDDVKAMGLALRNMPYNLQESPAMRHLADIGVLNMTQDDEGSPWTGINMASAQWFTWSAMQQMYERIGTLETLVAERV